MVLSKKDLGKRGEDEAAKFLSKLGWRVVERNYRCRLGELDIIALDNNGVLVFVEVRSRSGLSHGLPEESVVYRKQHKLRLLAQQYLLARPRFVDSRCRFDVMAVYFNGEGEKDKINHIKNAF